MNVAYLDLFVFLGKDGPVYSVQWSPNAVEFCVVYGCILFFIHLSSIKKFNNILYVIWKLKWILKAFPNKRKLCAISLALLDMPAKATIYNLKCEPVLDFDGAPRNEVNYSPVGDNILLLKFTKHLNSLKKNILERYYYLAIIITV